MSARLIKFSLKSKPFHASIGSWAAAVNAQTAIKVTTRRERREVENTDVLLMLRSAMFLECLCEFAGDLGCVAALDLKTFQHVDEFAVFENGDRRRGRSVAGEVAARAFGRFDIGAGEDRRHAI